MEFLVLFAVALVPALGLLFAPRAWVKPIGVIAAVLFGLCVLWTVSFSNSCQSDGCIGVFFLGAFTALVGILAAIAGIIRWALISSHDHRASSEEE
ncbi:MAG: hypothetical protein KGM49_10230 [Sphingomonadales bacterium]|nr:hypothetical protein [Sphingomonadales bacterium]